MELLYLNRVFQTRPGYGGEARGQMVFGDALFGRRETELGGFSAERVAKYAILLVNYGHLDIAKAIWDSSAEVKRLVPRLEEYFVAAQSKEERKVVMEGDKEICRKLSERRTNKLGFDSDRSWPVR